MDKYIVYVNGEEIEVEAPAVKIENTSGNLVFYHEKDRFLTFIAIFKKWDGYRWTGVWSSTFESSNLKHRYYTDSLGDDWVRMPSDWKEKIIASEKKNPIQKISLDE